MSEYTNIKNETEKWKVIIESEWGRMVARDVDGNPRIYVSAIFDGEQDMKYFGDIDCCLQTLGNLISEIPDLYPEIEAKIHMMDPKKVN